MNFNRRGLCLDLVYGLAGFAPNWRQVAEKITTGVPLTNGVPKVRAASAARVKTIANKKAAQLGGWKPQSKYSTTFSAPLVNTQ